MKLTGKVKKLVQATVALTLIAAMLFCNCGLSAIAGQVLPTKKYVSFGESMTNGFGFGGYDDDKNGYKSYGEGSYPKLFESWLNETYGGEYEIVHEALDMSGTRAIDLRFLLEYDWENDAELYGIASVSDAALTAAGINPDDVKTNNVLDYEKLWQTRYFQDYFCKYFKTGDPYTVDGFINARWPRYGDGSLKATAEYQQEAIADADIISMSIGNAEFGIFLMQRVMCSIGFEGAANEASLRKAGWVDTEDAIRSLDDYTKQQVMNILESAREALAEQLPAAEQNSIFAPIYDAMEYTIVSYIVNYIGILDRMDELNDKDNLDIILVSLINDYSDLAIKVDDETTIEFGKITDTIIEGINYLFAGYVTVAQVAFDKYENITFYTVPLDGAECIFEEYEAAANADWKKEQGNYLDYSFMRREIADSFKDYAKQIGSAVDMANLDQMVKDLKPEQIIECAELYKASFEDQDSATWLTGLTANQGANADKIKLGAIYYAFEKTVVATASHSTLSLEAMMSLSDMSGLFAEVAEDVETSYEEIVADNETLTSIVSGSKDLFETILKSEPYKTNYNKLYKYYFNTLDTDARKLSMLRNIFRYSLIDENNKDVEEAKQEAFIEALGYKKSQKATFFEPAAEILNATYIADAFKLAYLPEILSTTIADNDAVASLFHLLGRCMVGSGLGSHPTPAAHQKMFEQIVAVYSGKVTSSEYLKAASIKYLSQIIAWVDANDEAAFAEAYQYAVENGYVELLMNQIEALKAEIASEKAAFTAQTKAQVALVKAALEAQLAQLEASAEELNNIAVATGKAYHIEGKTFVLSTIANVNEAIAYVEAQIAEIKADLCEITALVKDCGETFDEVLVDIDTLYNNCCKLDDVITATDNYDGEYLVYAYNKEKADIAKAVNDICTLVAKLEKNIPAIKADVNCIIVDVNDTTDYLYNAVEAFIDAYEQVVEDYTNYTFAALEAAHEGVIKSYLDEIAEFEAAKAAVNADVKLEAAKAQVAIAEIEAQIADVNEKINKAVANHKAKKAALLEENKVAAMLYNKALYAIAGAVLYGYSIYAQEDVENVKADIIAKYNDYQTTKAAVEAKINGEIAEIYNDYLAIKGTADEKVLAHYAAYLEQIAKAEAIEAKAEAKVEAFKTEYASEISKLYTIYLLLEEDLKDAQGNADELILAAHVALEAEYEEQKAALEAKLAEELAVLDQQILAAHQVANEILAEKLEIAKAELKLAYTQAIAKLYAEINDKIDAIDAAINAELAHAVEIIEIKKAGIQARIERHINNLNTFLMGEHAKLLAKAQDLQEKVIAEIKAAEQKAIAEFEAQKAIYLAEAEKQIAAAMAQAGATEAEIKVAIAAIEAEYEAKVAEYALLTDAQLESAKTEIANQYRIAKTLVLTQIQYALATDAELTEETLNAQLQIIEVKAQEQLNIVMAALLEAYIKATTGVYETSHDSYYIALGDGSADSYAELVADAYGVKYKSLAKAGNKIENANVDIANNIVDIMKADFITIGYSNVEYIRLAVQALLSEEPIELDWAELVGENNVQYVEKIREAAIEKLIEEGVVETAGMNLPVMLENAAECIAYSAVSYAINMPKLVETLKVINPDATIVVVGQYNPLEDAELALSKDQIVEFGKYVDYLVEAVKIHGIATAIITGDMIFVEAPDVEIVTPKTTYSILDLAKLVMGNFADLEPSEAGAEYIKDQIINAVIGIDSVLLGDVNLDGEITSADATLILQYYAGVLKEEDTFCEAAADVNFDGEITSADATLVLQYYAGIIDTFEEEDK